MKHGYSSNITEITQQGSQEKHSFDISSPFNYTKFWSFIDEEFFSDLTEPKLIYACQLIHYFSNIAKASSSKQKKINSIEPLSQFIQKINNSNIGLHLVIPKKNDRKRIDEEISLISSAYNGVVKFNVLNTNRCLLDLARKESNVSVLSRRKEVDMRHKSLSEQIYNLQLRQFADSISRILFNEKESTYKIMFDPAENFESIKLSEEEYKELLSARDPINCIPVNDIFQDKERDLLNNQSKPKKKNHNKDTIINTSNGYGNKKQMTIGSFTSAHYSFCHHCKLRRQNVVYCQIQNNSCQGKPIRPNNDSETKMITEPKLKISSIHQGTLVKKDKIYYIDHYDGNIRELIENYYLYLKKTEYKCNKAYCEYCLKTNYNIALDQKTKKHFVCPSCLDICTCSRCFREDQLMKLVSCYLSLKGNIDDLFNYLTQRNTIMLKQIDNLMILKIINLSSWQCKSEMLDKKEQKEKEKELIDSKKLKEMLNDYSSYFQKEFNLAKKEEIAVSFYNDKTETNEEVLIGKKTQRGQKSYKSKCNDDYGDTSASSNDNGKKQYKRKNK